MGLGTSKRKFLSNEEIDRICSSNKTLEKLYSYIKGYDGYITKREFELIFNKKLSPKISNKLFKIFSSEKDKFFYDDLKYFYALMLTKMVQPKIHFFGELIFGEKSHKHVDRYIYRVGLIFPQEWKTKLTGKEFISKICEKGNLSKISKDNFFKVMGSFYDIPLINFEFLKNLNLPNAKKNNLRKFDKNKISLTCDCYSQLDSKSQQKSSNDLNEFLYDKMETEFRRMEKLNDGLFTIQMFDKILNDLEVNSKLISPISLYLKRKTQRNFIDFKTFKTFLLSFIGGTDARIKILFEILSFPKEYIDKKVLFALISSILPNGREEYILALKNSFDDKIFWEKFLTLFTQNTILYDILNSLNRINYIPFLYFKMRPEDKLDQKGCIEIITKGEKDLKKVVGRLLADDNENEFYCVNIEFWQSWCNYVQWDVSCKQENSETGHSKIIKISNEKIVGKFSGQLNKELIYFIDFVVLPFKIYDLFIRWYPSYGGEIKVKKIFYKSSENLNNKLSSLEEENLNKSISYKNLIFTKKNQLTIELDLYPIYSKHFTFEELIKNIKEISIDSTKALLKNLNESNLNVTRICQFSRKTSFGDIKTQLEKNSKINKPTNLWIFYKSEFYKCDLNKTLEEDSIEDICLFVLDNIKDNEWLSEYIIRMSKKILNKEQESSTNEQKITDTNHISQVQVPVSSRSNYTSTLTKESNISSPQFKNKTHIDPALMGIQNIGNTCYMNSVLQSLLNLDVIRQVFMAKNFKYFVNYKNKFGFKGRLMREFLKLLSEKWSNGEKQVKSLRPVKFKEIVGEINNQFKNNDQQDAQELINFLLDVLHEEINLKDEKEYIPNPEWHDYTEEELATEYWANNMRRNVSFIHSIFLGQMKSTLECDACGTNKISFETFSNLILPIPQKKTINLEVVFFRLPFTYKAYYMDRFVDKSLYGNYDSTYTGELNVRKSLNNLRKESFEVNEISNQEDFELNEMTLKMKSDAITDTSQNLCENLYTSKLTTSIPLKIILNVDRKSKVEKVISMLKKIKELELEKSDCISEIPDDGEDKGNITESKFCNPNIKNFQKQNLTNSTSQQYYTTYVIMSGSDGTFIDQDLKIDECFQNNQLIYVYELLNTNGINKIINSDRSFNSIGEVNIGRKNCLDKGFLKSINDQSMSLTQSKKKSSSTLVSLSTIPTENTSVTQKFQFPDNDTQEFEKISPLNYDTLSKYNKSNLLERQLNENYMEYLVQIQHRYPIETRDAYLFRKESFTRLDGFLNILLVNNLSNFNARFLYDYIWERYEYILNNPSKVKSNLWWIQGEKEYNSSKKEKYIKHEKSENYENSKVNSSSNGFTCQDEEKYFSNLKNFTYDLDKFKICTPFVIKILNKENNTCIRCPWYNFCTGCVLDPLTHPDTPLLISPSHVIVVEWCHQIVKKEMNENNLRLILNHESVKTKDEEKTSKSLEECLNLFLEKEYLEGEDQMIHCSRCRTSRNFYKKYDFDRMPPILILNIKRFKFAKMYKKKIDNLIEFPIYDLELKGSKYDLYSVINHSGVLSAGHYTSINKINNKWIKCDDANCYEVEENTIVSPGAYILIYKLKEPMENDYFKMMNNLLNNIDIQDSNRLKNTPYVNFSNKTFIPGEPVRTPYGRGFIKDEIIIEDYKKIHVKLRHGCGYIR
jgi:ubiquitin C-terminal hydrolase